MKKTFILFFCLVLLFSYPIQNTKCFADVQNKGFEIFVFVDDKTLKFKLFEYNNKTTKVQSKYLHNTNSLKLLNKMGFSKEDTIKYIFPETQKILNELCLRFNVEEKKESVYVEKNKCKLFFKEGSPGRFIDKEKFYNDVFNGFVCGEKNINIKLKFLNFSSKQQIKNLFCEKSCFSTNYSTSSSSRKNNIRVALEAFDGIYLENGELLSFNKTTGIRNEKAGYEKAKIISNGSFVEGFGGGVCQVSTTLYNACLLSGLEIIEANSHSLPVSYIEPGFDAMVNTGSSDLVVRNNSGSGIIITTSSLNDVCKVKIFGIKNKYKIVRHSEKTKIIPAEPDIVETDITKFSDIKIEVGEEKRISYSKDGFTTKSYLCFYDTSGKLVKTENIRQNIYNPTKGVILKREK